MLEISGPQLRPLANLLLKFDKLGRVPNVYNLPKDFHMREQNGIIVVSYPHRTYNERYFISRAGTVDRVDIAS